MSFDGVPTDPRATWRRPEVPPSWGPWSGDLTFQQIEVEESMDEPVEGMPDPPGSRAPIIRLYGVTKEGVSVFAHVHGFLPYFYIPAPHGFETSHCGKIRRTLSARLDGTAESVSSVECVARKSIYGYQGDAPTQFLKITLCNPRKIRDAHRFLEQMFPFPSGAAASPIIYESNLSYTMRFMIDLGITGINWVTLAQGTYMVRGRDSRISTCGIEVDVSYMDLVSLPATTDEHSTIAPLRILSFDIECAGRKGVFPDSSIDPVIQIANMVTIQGEARPFIRNVFTLNTCSSITGAHVLSYRDERSLLAAWKEFVRLVDPDVLTGYNIQNFDLFYLLGRASALRIYNFPYLGRLISKQTVVTETRFSSKAYGTRDNKEVNIEGRLQLDVIKVIQRDYKLRSYSLNSVSAHFLDEQKEDVAHTEITDLQNGNADTRRRLAVYCLKDAYLPQRLIDKLMIFVNYIEMSRVTGVPFNYLLARGQQIRVVSQLFRKARAHDLVIPTMEVVKTGDEDDVMYEGATVLDPKTGYYSMPIATLDFASLYPSIMMAQNLCYTTLISPERIAELGFEKGTDYVCSPSGDFFVTQSRAKGILPIILEDLLGARKRAKADLKKETDPFKRAVLDGRQLALKVSANSVYGFTGATVGKLPCLPISRSTTAFGREMIETTKETVESTYNIRNGFKHDADVIYGDTDSVMIKFGTDDLAEAMELGRVAADLVTSKFKKPIKLEFEKVFWPYLLINKKRYAGLYWTRTDKYDKLDCKGLESVRRDNSRLVSLLVDTSLRKLLVDRDVPGAIAFAKQIISDVLQNKVDISNLVITKALSKSRDDYAGKQAHAELAERMRKRDAGSAPAIGDRVAYVIIKSANKAAAYEKAEDPLYVLQNNIPIDATYYIENQLKKPLLRIFGPIIPNAESELLKGEHTLTKQIAAPTTGPLSAFTVRRSQCLGCRAVLKDDRAVCLHCQKDTVNIYRKQLDVVNDVEMRFARLWTQCQRCTGTLHNDVICSNSECDIFYMRVKARVDAQKAAGALERFDTNMDW